MVINKQTPLLNTLVQLLEMKDKAKILKKGRGKKGIVQRENKDNNYSTASEIIQRRKQSHIFQYRK